jgi:hypothetical protein
LRKATKAASSKATGGLAATGVYGLIGGGGGGLSGRICGVGWFCARTGTGLSVAAAKTARIKVGATG